VGGCGAGPLGGGGALGGYKEKWVGFAPSGVVGGVGGGGGGGIVRFRDWPLGGARAFGVYQAEL